MAIRDSQDLDLALAQNPGTPRDSQDLTLALAANPGTPRDSQDVNLVLASNPGTLRVSQDFILVLQKTVFSGPIADSQSQQTLDVAGTSSRFISTTQASQSLAASATQTLPPVPDKPPNQFHPVLKPLDFYSRPLTQAGRPSGAFNLFLSEPGANRALSMPLGARNQPVSGKVLSFSMGGTITPGAVGGTMVITPLYGATSNGVNLGPSSLQSYPASIDPLPWRLKGEIIFQTIDLTPGMAQVICSGVFMMAGDPTVADSGIECVFGSASPVQVDLSAVGAVASGALNFAVSFGPSVFNVSPPTISTKYAFVRRY